MESALPLGSTRDERDVGSRGGVDDGVFVEEKSAPGFDGDNAKMSFGGDFNGRFLQAALCA